jgi:5-formyltetrahydrofolate cyclo-ligase
MRLAMLLRRASLPEDERRTAADRLVEALRREGLAEPPAVVSGFWPINEEIDIRPLMADLSSRGCRLALPVVQGKRVPLLFRAWQPGDPLESGVFGTLQPSAQREAVEPDILIVPLLACDGEGWRLGYGGGFYDRTLAGFRRKRAVTAIGVGFDVQLVPEVPHGPNDERLDWLLTERRAYAFV